MIFSPVCGPSLGQTQTLQPPDPSSLRVAEEVWQEGVLLKHFPPEASEIKCLDDSWALLKV